MEILTNLRKTLIEVSSWFAGLLNDADGIALAIAILTPALLIFGRREIRYRRLIALRNLASSYPALAEKGLNPQRYADEINPSFEFVKDKYVAEVRSVKAAGAKAAEWPPLNQIENAIRAARAFGSIWEVRLFLAGSGLMIITYYGMINLQHLLSSGISIPSTAINGDNCPPETAFKQTQLIGTLTFAGAFVAALRVFMRGLAVFDLSAYIFLRQTAAIFSSVIITIFLYKAFPDPIKPIEALLTGASGGSARCDVPWVWLALAPVLGLIPFSAIKFIMIRLQSVINWVKSDDDRFVRQTRVITVDVIDGVDYDTRFRLEECGIYDVQNLATYNPILLHIESPFQLYQTVDWVAQAQLCHMIGLEKFLFLRHYNIRTIFDLERAIDYRSRGGKNAPLVDGPDEFDKIYAGILFAPTVTLKEVANIGGLQPFILKGKAVSPANVNEYCEWALLTIQADGDQATLKACVEHMMGWIADDLHVRRLRRIWQEMSDSLGKRTMRLDNDRK